MVRILWAIPLKKLVGRVSALLTHILRVGGPENFAILWVDAILGVCGPKNCNSGGGWFEKKSADTPTTNVLME